ncbi:MAG: cytochrome oxidase small assembly protein [Rhodocyclaceae bacterium]|nr:cytochrome oxidase small assembly protein [Rhodocyclaceae bacterium]
MERMSDGKQPRNLRTALILLSVALVFFIGIMLKTWLFGHA